MPETGQKPLITATKQYKLKLAAPFMCPANILSMPTPIVLYETCGKRSQQRDHACLLRSFKQTAQSPCFLAVRRCCLFLFCMR